MQKEKKNMRKINFKRAVTQKFKEFDQKLEVLTQINVSEEIDKAVHAKVLTKIKKLISTHVLKFLANYLKLHYKNDVELEYQVDQLKAAVLSEAQWNSDEGDVSKPRSFERHMSKSSKTYPRFYNNDFYYLAYLSTEEKYTTSLTKHYVASDEKDFNKALLLFIQITIIKNRVEDLQLGVDSYQWNLNLTKPKHYFDGIDENIPYIMTGIEKGVVYLNKYNRRSLIKLNEVHKFCDGTLMKIQENLIEMIIKNKLGRGNER
ncbi:hypothetical protein Tco_1176185 [Tanacetum coccineum]